MFNCHYHYLSHGLDTIPIRLNDFTISLRAYISEYPIFTHKWFLLPRILPKFFQRCSPANHEFICEVQVTKHFFHEVFTYLFSRLRGFFLCVLKQFKWDFICIIICYLKDTPYFSYFIMLLSHLFLNIIINNFTEIHSILGH